MPPLPPRLIRRALLLDVVLALVFPAAFETQTPREIAWLIRTRGGALPDDLKAQATARMHTPLANRAEADKIAAHFRKVHA